MYYTLKKNVYYVSGYRNGCIYDMNKCLLFQLNSDLAEKFRLIDEGSISDNDVDAELKECLDYFISNEILELGVEFEQHDICELRDCDSRIMFAWIEITNKCNLRCRHCYNESGVFCESKMSFEQFCLVIDCLIEMGIEKIQIIGGEPFFDKEILKKDLDYTIGKFKRVEVFTNGTLISDEWFDYFAKNQIAVALSVYSYNNNEHDKVTGLSGSWDKTNETIRKLKDYNIQYRVCNVLMDEVDVGSSNNELYRLSLEKDVVRMSGRGDFTLLSDELIKKRLITKKTFAHKSTVSFYKRMVNGHNCFNSRIYVSANLDVYPCVMERRIKHCNIIEKKRIILNDEIRKLDKSHIIECRDCELRYACFDCRPDSLSGGLLEKPWYCTYSPYKGEWVNEDQFIMKLKEKWS